MRPLVHKYGGSSLSTLGKVRQVARKLIAAQKNGHPIVAVASAMGGTTNRLLSNARELSEDPPRRELDMLLSAGERMSTALLAMAIESEGHAAISLTGPQCGIQTDENHTNASIREVRPDRVREELAAGKIVIVAGFQGTSPSGEVTTLGRGGSDTTAVALAAALGSPACVICSDVPGIYTADPRVVEEAQAMPSIEADAMVEFARLGARVLHPACVEFARNLQVTIIARSTFTDEPGTEVTPTSEYSGMSSPTSSVLGVTSRESVVALIGKEGSDPQRLVEVTMTTAGAGAEVIGEDADTSLVLLDLEDHPSPEEVQQVLREALACKARLVGDLCAVSVVCAGQPDREFGERVQTTLSEGGLRPLARVSTGRAVTVALPSKQREQALCVLHQALVGAPEPVEA